MIVTNHAAQRLLERANELGADIRPLITEKIAKAMIALGDGQYPLPGGMRAVVCNQVIVTVLPAKDHGTKTQADSSARPKKHRKRRSFYREPREAWGSD